MLGGTSLSVESKFPTRAFSMLILNDSFRSHTSKFATSLFWVTFRSKVPRFIFRFFTGALIFSIRGLLMALQFAPVSSKAYVGHFSSPADTKTGTVGRIAPWPAYAAASQHLLVTGLFFSMWVRVWCRPLQVSHLLGDLHSGEK